MSNDTLMRIVRRVVLFESRMREADVTGGNKVPFGSDAHVKDLKTRIRDLTMWRDSQKKGSEARANYARVIARLRNELRSALRVNLRHAEENVGEESINESANTKDPEYASVNNFVEYMFDDEREEYTYEDLAALNFRTRTPVSMLRKELDSYGLRLANRPFEKEVRGVNSNSNDRWHGKGSEPMHGGAGIDSATGRATVRGRTI